MKLIELTTDNVFNYIGYNILYKSRNEIKLSKINKISSSGKTIYIDNEDLNNCLEITSRNIYVIIQYLN
jgi:hypothetical protein